MSNSTLVSTPSLVGSAKSKPTTGLYPEAPTPDMNPGQCPGSGMAGSGNTAPSSVPRNEGCIDPGERSFS